MPPLPSPLATRLLYMLTCGHTSRNVPDVHSQTVANFPPVTEKHYTLTFGQSAQFLL